MYIYNTIAALKLNIWENRTFTNKLDTNCFLGFYYEQIGKHVRKEEKRNHSYIESCIL